MWQGENKQQRKFSWKGIHSSGKMMSDSGYALNPDELKKTLHAQNITLLRFKKERSLFLKNQISFKKISELTRQLSTLINAGISISDSLQLLIQSQPNNSVNRILQRIKEKISQGFSLKQALHIFPQYFNTMYLSLIEAGEQSGQLATTLNHLANYQERSLQIKSKIIKAIIYPSVVLVITILVTAALLIFVVPQFQSVFNQFNAQLPFLTRWVIYLSSIITRHFTLLLTTIISLFLIFKILLTRSNYFIFFLHSLFLKIPYIGLLIQKNLIARWSQVMALLIRSGLPLIDAIHIANRTNHNCFFYQSVEKLTESILSGNTLHEALKKTNQFPKQVIQMITIGENSGNLDTMLQKIGDIYQQEVAHTLDNLNQLLEPLIMLILAIVIGGLVIAMYLPVFSIGQVLSS